MLLFIYLIINITDEYLLLYSMLLIIAYRKNFASSRGLGAQQVLIGFNFRRTMILKTWCDGRNSPMFRRTFLPACSGLNVR